MMKYIMKRNVSRWIPALLALVLVASCTSSKKQAEVAPEDQTVAKWNASVKTHVSDQARAERLMVLGKQMISIQKSLTASINDLANKLAASNAEYDTTKEEADALYAEFMQHKNAAMTQYRDVLFAMRKETTEHEWNKLVN